MYPVGLGDGDFIFSQCGRLVERAFDASDIAENLVVGPEREGERQRERVGID